MKKKLRNKWKSADEALKIGSCTPVLRNHDGSFPSWKADDVFNHRSSRGKTTKNIHDLKMKNEEKNTHPPYPTSTFKNIRGALRRKKFVTQKPIKTGVGGLFAASSAHSCLCHINYCSFQTWSCHPEQESGSKRILDRFGLLPDNDIDCREKGKKWGNIQSLTCFLSSWQLLRLTLVLLLPRVKTSWTQLKIFSETQNKLSN